MPVNCLLVGPGAALPGSLAVALSEGGFVAEAAAGPDALRPGARPGRRPALCFVPHDPAARGVLRAIRLVSTVSCVVVAAAAVESGERVALLDAGADEVLDAGVPPPEAVARVRALLRRAASGPAPLEAADGEWRLSHRTRLLAGPGGGSHRLTAAEFDLLRALAAAAGAPVDRDAISRQALRRPWRPEDRSVDGLVKRLRRKLGPEAIQTARGLGYALAVVVHSV